MGLSFAGDLRTCFLLDEGWAFRLEVNHFVLDGRAGWRLPLAYAEEIELGEDEHRFFEPAHPRLGEEVALSRVDGKCVGGPIDKPLRGLRATEGDLAFFAVRRGLYDIVMRRKAELDEEDPLGRLLWSCGLDPGDAQVRVHPWRPLARRLGRSTGGREEVRSALVKRRDEALVHIVDELGRRRDRTSRHTISSEPWPPGWEYVMPLTQEEHSFALVGGDHSHRSAVGVADTSGQPPRELVRSAGGLVWMHRETAIEQHDVMNLLRASPTGMHPAAHKENWVRWLRAEHWARRSALLGAEWEIEVADDRWLVGTMKHEKLVSALEHVHLDTEEIPSAPARGARFPYPVSASVFSRAAKDAVRNGLQRILANERFGFVAEYEGRERSGPALLDVLG